MVAFNPDVPDSPAPNYLAWSKPPRDFEGDKSKGIALKGLGDAFESAVKGTDDLIKTYLEGKVSTDFEEEKQQKMADLEVLAGFKSPSVVPDQEEATSYGANDNPPNPLADKPDFKVIPGSQPILPQGLQSSVPEMDRQLGAINTGKAVKPEIESYYTALEDMKLKDWRNRWGGYWGYGKVIDSIAQRQLGYDPANKRISDLYRIIQANQENTDKTRERVIEETRKSEFVDDAGGLIRRIQTPGTPEYNNPVLALTMAEANKKKAHVELSRQSQKNAVDIQNNQLSVIENKDKAVSVASDYVDGLYQDLKFRYGIDDEKIKKGIVEDVPPQEAQKRAAAIDQLTGLAETELQKLLRPMEKVLPEGTVKSIIDNKLSPLRKIRENYYKGDASMATFMERQNDLAVTYAHTKLLQDPTIGQVMTMSEALGTKFGQAAQPFINDLKMYGIKNGKGAVEGLLTRGGLGMATTPGEPGAMTADQLVQNFQKLDVGNVAKKGQEAAAERKAYLLPADVANWISNPKYDPGIRKALASNLFQGAYVHRYEDPHAMYAQITRPDVIQSIWELSGHGVDPLWQQHKNWVTDQSRVLAQGDVVNLDRVRKYNPDAVFTWDTDTQKLDLAFKPNTGRPFADALYERQINYFKSYVDRFNTSMRPLAEIAKLEGANPNGTILKNLSEMRFQLKGIAGIDEIMKTIAGPSPFDQQPPKASEKATGKRSALEGMQIASTAPGLGFTPDTGVATTADLVASNTKRSRNSSRSYEPPSAPTDVEQGVIDRSRFRQELESNPRLREKALAISLAENLHPKANLSIFETAMNRADVRGTTLAKALTLTSESKKAGYYPKAAYSLLRDPRYRALAEKNLELALAGSNVSDFATDNASSWLADKNIRLKRFEKRTAYGSGNDLETFFAPLKYGRAKYDSWKSRVEQARQQRLKQDEGKVFMAEGE